MARAIVVAGATLIKIASPTGGALEELGHTVGGVQILEQVYYGDVPCDEDGGELGPEADVQYFGEKHIITMALSKYDTVVAAKVQAGYAGLALGAIGVRGTLMRQGGVNYRLALASVGFNRNYTDVVFRGGREINVGSKYSTLVLIAHAYRNITTGVLHNATVT